MKGACGGPASSQQFPESEKLPAGVGLALQMWLTGVQILSGWEACRNSAFDDRAKGQAFICQAWHPRSCGLQDMRLGANPAQPALAVPHHHRSGIPLCPGSSSTAALLLLWAQPVPMIHVEQADVRSRGKAPRQLLFWSQLCFCTSLSCLVLSGHCMAAAHETILRMAPGHCYRSQVHSPALFIPHTG